MKFKLSKKLKSRGDQPQAIEKLIKGIKAGVKHQVGDVMEEIERETKKG